MDLGFIILIPLIFLSIAYNVYLKYKKIETDISKDLFAGFNYLLNKQTHEAESIFKKISHIDKYSFETYLALGNLYRHEGKLDQAILVHESIISKKTLKQDFRYNALIELATDYLCSGILDKAENIFIETQSIKKYRKRSQESLLKIYQQLSDWPQAIKTANKIASASKSDMSFETVHFYCEIIDNNLKQKNFKQALLNIKSAQAIDKTHIRLNLVLISYYIDVGCIDLAIENIIELVATDPAYILVTHQQLYYCYNIEEKQEEFFSYVISTLLKASNFNVIIKTLLFINSHSYYNEGVRALLIKVISNDSMPKSVANLVNIKDMKEKYDYSYYNDVLNVLDIVCCSSYSYKCSSCGFNSNSIYWLCPGCLTWGNRASIPISVSKQSNC